jgi:transcription elongation factor Elf1
MNENKYNCPYCGNFVYPTISLSLEGRLPPAYWLCVNCDKYFDGQFVEILVEEDFEDFDKFGS